MYMLINSDNVVAIDRHACLLSHSKCLLQGQAMLIYIGGIFL